MAANIYEGGAQVVPSEATLTPGGTLVAGDRFRILIGSRYVEAIAPATPTVAEVLDELAIVLASDLVLPEHDECTWADETTTLRMTGPDDGRPVTQALTAQVWRNLTFTLNLNGSTGGTFDLVGPVDTADDVDVATLDADAVAEAVATAYGVAAEDVTVTGTYVVSLLLPVADADTPTIADDNTTGGSTPTISGSNATTAATFTVAVVEEGTGPHDWANDANWSDGTPGLGFNDEMVFGLFPYCPKYNVDLSVTNNGTVRVVSGDTSGLSVGLPAWNEDGGYVEYLARYLKIAVGTIIVGEGDGDNVPQLYINTQASTTTLRVLKSEERDADGRAPVSWLCAAAGSLVADCRGALDVAAYPGETATLLSALTNGEEADVRLGSGVTITTIYHRGGTMRHAAAATTINVGGAGLDATLTLENAGNITTLNNEVGGSVIFNRTGTVTTYVGRGSIDFSQHGSAKTITNCDLHAGAAYLDPLKVVTETNGVDLNHCDQDEVTIRKGTNRRLTFGTAA